MSASLFALKSVTVRATANINFRLENEATFYENFLSFSFLIPPPLSFLILWSLWEVSPKYIKGLIIRKGLLKVGSSNYHARVSERVVRSLEMKWFWNWKHHTNPDLIDRCWI